jgi:tetratricopeptide (TPR) repeat protein
MGHSTRWQGALALALLTTLGGCAQLAPPIDWDPILSGAPFPVQAEPDPAALFALSPAMAQFLRQELRQATRRDGPMLGLFRALSEGGHLRIDYDASRTRTAAEAFEARAGNCLSLVLMTASLARELGLSVRYQLVEVPDIWTRSEQFTLLNGHVNLSLGEAAGGRSWQEMGHYTIDFQPVEDPRLARVRLISERTVVAMFFNNRAVELMEQGAWNEAYATLRAALRADPKYQNSINTLGVLLRRVGDLPRAEQLLLGLLKQEPYNRHAASNLALLWRQQGRTAEAEALERDLPPAPFADFERGLLLAANAQWPAALAAFERQLRLSPDFHGLHFQLARAHLQLGHLRQARHHLEEASEQAPTSALRQRYQGKVRALRRAS